MISGTALTPTIDQTAEYAVSICRYFLIYDAIPSDSVSCIGWTDELELAFEEALELYSDRKMRSYKTASGITVHCGRNEAISRYIFYKTGLFKSTKQISSHIAIRSKKIEKLMQQEDTEILSEKYTPVDSPTNSSTPAMAVSSPLPPTPQSPQNNNIDLHVKHQQQQQLQPSPEKTALKAETIINWQNSLNDKLKQVQQYNAVISPVASVDPVVFHTRSIMTLASSSTGNVAHVSLAHQNGEYQYLSAFQFSNYKKVDIITTIVSFGNPILRYGQRFETVLDEATGFNLVVADNICINAFINFFADHVRPLPPKVLENVVSNLMIYQTVLEAGGESGHAQVPFLELISGLEFVSKK